MALNFFFHIYLNGGERIMESSYLLAHFPYVLNKWAWACQSRNLGLSVGLQCEWQGPRDLSHPCCLPRVPKSPNPRHYSMDTGLLSVLTAV